MSNSENFVVELPARRSWSGICRLMEPIPEGHLFVLKYELKCAGYTAFDTTLIPFLNRGLGNYKNVSRRAGFRYTSKHLSWWLYIFSISATVSSIGVGFNPFSARSCCSVGSSI